MKDIEEAKKASRDVEDVTLDYLVKKNPLMGIVMTLLLGAALNSLIEYIYEVRTETPAESFKKGIAKIQAEKEQQDKEDTFVLGGTDVKGNA